MKNKITRKYLKKIIENIDSAINTTITPTEWEITDGVYSIYVSRKEDGYSISTNADDYDFCFVDYKTVEGLKKADTVINKLLPKALEYIEGELKK
ncbi:MAG: hypothetical protein AAB922_01655 [Patescibacteria group bacterium]|mgnify:FL=1